MSALYVNNNTGEVLCQEEIELTDGKRDWKGRKKMAIKVAKLMRVYDRERADKIDSCGTYLKFVKTPDNKQSLRNANFCRERLCPMCQWRRSIKLGIQANKIYQALIEKGYQHVFVTLTVRNCPGSELVETVDHLVKSVQRWSRHDMCKRAFRGSYRALEITYNSEKDTYHPHMHLLLTVPGDYFRPENPDYITKDKLIMSWKQAAQLDYEPSVDIEGITPKKGQTMTSACLEMCKYPAKTAEIDTSDVLYNIDQALRGRRLVQWGGVAAEVRRELALDDIESGNLVQLEENEVGGDALEELVYVWRYGMYVPLDIKRLES